MFINTEDATPGPSTCAGLQKYVVGVLHIVLQEYKVLGVVLSALIYPAFKSCPHYTATHSVIGLGWHTQCAPVCLAAELAAPRLSKTTRIPGPTYSGLMTAGAHTLTTIPQHPETHAPKHAQNTLHFLRCCPPPPAAMLPTNR